MHVARTGEKRNAYKIYYGIPKGSGQVEILT